jgi:hypothetical protein
MLNVGMVNLWLKIGTPTVVVEVGATVEGVTELAGEVVVEPATASDPVPSS